MAFNARALYRNCNYVRNITKPLQRSIAINHPARILSSGISCQRNAHCPIIELKQFGLSGSIRHFSSQGGGDNVSKPPQEPEPKKPGIFQRFKEMYRDYWYVLLPVHIVTSAVWFGSFYYAVRSGVDVLAILQSIGVSDKLLTPLRESSAGYFALAFALYKLVTPLRYAVTVGGTTVAIKKLTLLGVIKPVPSGQRIKEMFQEKKDNLQESIKESKLHYQTQMKEKRSSIMEEMRRYKTEIRNMKNKVKKM